MRLTMTGLATAALLLSATACSSGAPREQAHWGQELREACRCRPRHRDDQACLAPGPRPGRPTGCRGRGRGRAEQGRRSLARAGRRRRGDGQEALVTAVEPGWHPERILAAAAGASLRERQGGHRLLGPSARPRGGRADDVDPAPRRGRSEDRQGAAPHRSRFPPRPRRRSAPTRRMRASTCAIARAAYVSTPTPARSPSTRPGRPRAPAASAPRGCSPPASDRARSSAWPATGRRCGRSRSAR